MIRNRTQVIKKTRPAPSYSSDEDLDNELYCRYSRRTRFSILSKCVKTLRRRHQADITAPIGIEEMLYECKLEDMDEELKEWLEQEALPDNEKIQCLPSHLYKYKPSYNIPNMGAFLALLRDHDRRGLGGIWLDDIVESLPRADKVLEKTRESYTVLMRKTDKRQVVYYRRKSREMKTSEALQGIWNQASVSQMSDLQIEAYLKKNGIRPFMAREDTPPAPPPHIPKLTRMLKTRVTLPANIQKLRDNTHVAHLLKNYNGHGREIVPGEEDKREVDVPLPSESFQQRVSKYFWKV